MRWFLPPLISGVFRVWRDDWKALPSTARRGWWVQLGWGVLWAQLLCVGLIVGGRYLEAAGSLAGETAFLTRLERLELLSFNDAIWLDVFGNGFVLAMLMILSAGLAGHRRMPLVAMALLLGYASLFMPVLTGWLAWSRDRPTVIASGIGSPGSTLSSFPSGHLVQAIVAFGMLCFLWIRATRSTLERLLAATLFLLVVSVVTIARLRLGAHWPSDMVGAALIGAFWLGAVIRALVMAERTAAAAKHSVRSVRIA